MQPDLERNRSNPRYKNNAPTTLRGKLKDEFDIQGETIRKGQLQGALERRTFAQETSVFIGTILVVMAFVGFVVDNLLGAHLTPVHNLIHLAAGALLIIYGFRSEVRAKKCSLIFGAFFAVLGVLGFIVGTPGLPNVGNLVRDDSLWLISPEHLEFGSADHSMHLIFAGVLLAGAIFKFRRLRRESF